MNFGDTKVELVFVTANADVEPPPPITILEVPEGSGQGSDEMPPALATRLASALRGSSRGTAPARASRPRARTTSSS